MSKSNLKKALGWQAFALAIFAVSSLGARADVDANSLENFHKAEDIWGTQALTSGNHRFLVKKANSKDLTTRAPLWIGFPLDLDGENFLFGSAITGVSDTQDTQMGDLKMSNFSVPVKARLAKNGNNQTLQLWAKVGGAENAPLTLQLELPVQELDAANKVAYVDMAPAAAKLNFFNVNDTFNRSGDSTGDLGLKFISSWTKAVDFTGTVFVFDIESEYEKTDAGFLAALNPGSKPATNVTFSTRWFLRLNSGLDGNFIPRLPNPAVGFLTQAKTNPDLSRVSRSRIWRVIRLNIISRTYRLVIWLLSPRLLKTGMKS